MASFVCSDQLPPTTDAPGNTNRNDIGSTVFQADNLPELECLCRHMPECAIFPESLSLPGGFVFSGIKKLFGLFFPSKGTEDYLKDISINLRILAQLMNRNSEHPVPDSVLEDLGESPEEWKQAQESFQKSSTLSFKDEEIENHLANCSLPLKCPLVAKGDNFSIPYPSGLADQGSID